MLSLLLNRNVHNSYDDEDDIVSSDGSADG